MVKYIPEPFRIKMVENIKMLTREERCDKIREASYNLFRLKGEDVYIDTLTDSGTNAMSSEMWSGLLRGDEAYAGAKSYYRFIQACQDVFGYGFFCPVHQGRAAEKVLFPNLLHPGTYALANLFLTPPAAMWCSPVPERWSASARKPSTPSWSPPSRETWTPRSWSRPSWKRARKTWGWWS